MFSITNCLLGWFLMGLRFWFLKDVEHFVFRYYSQVLFFPRVTEGKYVPRQATRRVFFDQIIDISTIVTIKIQSEVPTIDL